MPVCSQINNPASLCLHFIWLFVLWTTGNNGWRRKEEKGFLKLSCELIAFVSIPIYNNRCLFPALCMCIFIHKEKSEDSNGAFLCLEGEDEMKWESLKQEQRTTDSITFMVSLFWFSEDKERPLSTGQPDEVLCITNGNEQNNTRSSFMKKPVRLYLQAIKE